MNNKMKQNTENKKRTWLELTPEEIKNLTSKNACMYGKKSKNITVLCLS